VIIRDMKCPRCRRRMQTDGLAVWCEPCELTFYWDQPIRPEKVKLS
jgi:hypothetical protein